MASVSSLDKDLRGLRLDKYTPQRANETREWIETVLGERLKSGDLLEALKDGIALCKLINLALGPNGVRYKESAMPFVQMENISHFLRACQAQPLGLLPHDVFLTVDLYEGKDPAQVLQCISAFSRKAATLEPSKFPRAIGKSKSARMSPQTTGGSTSKYQRGRGGSNASESSTSTYNPISRNAASPPVRNNPTTTSPPSAVSSWSKKGDEGATTPAWNIHQYGYMGGASQGNQGIMFGGRRQITTPGPKVPSLAEKERKRREEAAEAERLRALAEEAEHQRRVEREAEEERERIEDERRREEQGRKQRERERIAAEEEKRRWEAEERRWKEEEEVRIREEKEAEARLDQERSRRRAGSDARLTGQFLSQYQAEQRQQHPDAAIEDPERAAERERVKDLERQLREAKERETRYEQERQERSRFDAAQQPSVLRNPKTAPHAKELSLDWDESERDYLRAQHAAHTSRPTTTAPPPQPARPLPAPQLQQRPPQATQAAPPAPARPLPDPAAYASSPNSRAQASPTKAGRPTSSLLEREMERERLRQREWEASQRATADAAARGVLDGGSGPGESWDVNQYGYTGGDSQNRGALGVNIGARRQILGPRPLGPRPA